MALPARKTAAMEIKKFLPSLEQVSRETIAVLCATVLVAWAISKSPALRKLVKDNSIDSPLS